jgi:hypothetical protein
VYTLNALLAAPRCHFQPTGLLIVGLSVNWVRRERDARHELAGSRLEARRTLSGLWFLICTLLITIPALLIVGAMITFRWARSFTETPGKVSPSLVVLTVALLPNVVMLVNLFTGFLIRVIPNSDNVPLFSSWQIISGVLIALALFLSLSEKKEGKNVSLWASLILLSIHGAGTALFFSDTLLSLLKI